jgi:aspartate/methionine/tyrosine aminotransferase
MVFPEALLHAINSLQQNMFITGTISQMATLECWDEEMIAEPYQLPAYFRAAPKVNTIASQECGSPPGSFYIYLDLGDDKIAPGFGYSVKMCECLLEEKYVAFTPGIDFEDPATNIGKRFQISYAKGIYAVQEAIEWFYQFCPHGSNE